MSAPFLARRDDRLVRRAYAPVRLGWNQFWLLSGILGGILALAAVVMLAYAAQG
ncbi:MAG TPA: hypothetical protein VKE51_00495 [Vicinamibacterales bacterium]|nr:hypothetical protein [Vicinamibacterales bacterium]